MDWWVNDIDREGCFIRSWCWFPCSFINILVSVMCCFVSLKLQSALVVFSSVFLVSWCCVLDGEIHMYLLTVVLKKVNAIFMLFLCMLCYVRKNVNRGMQFYEWNVILYLGLVNIPVPISYYLTRVHPGADPHASMWGRAHLLDLCPFLNP